MRLEWETREVRTQFEFRIAHGSKRAHRNAFVRLTHDGIVGLGEAAPSHYYGESAELVDAALAAFAPVLGDDPFAFDAIETRLDGVFAGHGSARAAGWLVPSRVYGLALNTHALDATEAKRAIEHAGQMTGLAVCDPVRFGAEPLATALVRRLEERRRRAS